MIDRIGWAVVLVLGAWVMWLSPINPLPTEARLDPWGYYQDIQPPSQNDQALFLQSRGATVRIEDRYHAWDSQPESIGTGVFISADGFLLTAYHVIEGAPNIQIVLASRQRLAVDVIGFDSARDIALLKARTNQEVPFLPLVKQSPRVGEMVLAIGNSGGDFLQPRRGRLLRTQVRSARADFPQNTLELNAPIAPGDSGGPIINRNGQVIGLVSYIRMQDSGELLSAYAVPVLQSAQLLSDLYQGIKRDVPVIGFQTYIPQNHSYAELGLSVDYGVIIGTVVQGGPASAAGLKSAREYSTSEGVHLQADVITEIEGVRIEDYDALVQTVRGYHIGDTITLTVRRGNESLALPVTLGAKTNVFHDPK